MGREERNDYLSRPRTKRRRRPEKREAARTRQCYANALTISNIVGGVALCAEQIANEKRRFLDRPLNNLFRCRINFNRNWRESPYGKHPLLTIFPKTSLYPEYSLLLYPEIMQKQKGTVKISLHKKKINRDAYERLTEINEEGVVDTCTRVSFVFET